MAQINISGDSSGSIAIVAPAVAGTTTLNLPATTGTVLNDATCGVCKAWVSCNVSGGATAIRASYNVSSVTYRGTGAYTVNLTNALADTNYSAVAVAGTDTSGTGRFFGAYPSTSSAILIASNQSTGTALDVVWFSAAIFR